MLHAIKNCSNRSKGSWLLAGMYLELFFKTIEA